MDRFAVTAHGSIAGSDDNSDKEQRKIELSQQMKNSVHLAAPANFQAINQAYAELGIAVGMPDEWPVIEQMSETVASSSLIQTRHHDARRLAGATVDMFRQYVRESGETLYGDDDHESNGTYVLFGFDPKVLFAINERRTVESLAREHLSSRYTDCDVGASIRCQTSQADRIISVYYGEFVCLYKCCAICLDWFDDPDRHYDESINFALPGWDSDHVAT